MKKEFSKQWKASKQPRKQRKYIANAPLHTKRNLLSVNLSKELRKQHQKRSVVLRKGDKIKVLRGAHKGKTGKVSSVAIKKTKVYVEGIQKQKNDGSKVLVKLQPSNLQITELSLEDNKRLKTKRTTNKKETEKEKNSKKQESKKAENTTKQETTEKSKDKESKETEKKDTKKSQKPNSNKQKQENKK